jgi:acetylglutamate/LysW-gamma-L-alpha-aminoadipate kinase
MMVVKVGGSEGIDLALVCQDLAQMVKAGEKVVLVHGGSHETDLISAKLGKPPRFVTSVSGFESRYTDEETIQIFTMVYAGKVNKEVVANLARLGVKAVGLSGVDGRVFEGRRKEAIRIREGGKRKVLRGDYTGRVEKVNAELLELLLQAGYMPVLCPPAISYQGEIINVDGDRAAAALAAALDADTLVILSNVPGLLEDAEDEGTLVGEIDAARMDEYYDYAAGRMKKKLMGAEDALRRGVSRVILADGRVEAPIQRALEGKGTVIQ